MYVKFSQSTACWSCKGFQEFRKKLAREIGVNLDRMAGSDTLYNVDSFGLLSWETVDDPVIPILSIEQDYQMISYMKCREVSERLQELIASWEDSDYDKQQALILAKDIQYCGSKGQPFEIYTRARMLF